MLLTLRKTFVLVLMLLALLAGLVGWSVRMATTPAMHHPIGTHSIQNVTDSTWYCPGPPRSC